MATKERPLFCPEREMLFPLALIKRRLQTRERREEKPKKKIFRFIHTKADTKTFPRGREERRERNKREREKEAGVKQTTHAKRYRK